MYKNWISWNINFAYKYNVNLNPRRKETKKNTPKLGEIGTNPQSPRLIPLELFIFKITNLLSISPKDVPITRIVLRHVFSLLSNLTQSFNPGRRSDQPKPASPVDQQHYFSLFPTPAYCIVCSSPLFFDLQVRSSSSLFCHFAPCNS